MIITKLALPRRFEHIAARDLLAAQIAGLARHAAAANDWDRLPVVADADAALRRAFVRLDQELAASGDATIETRKVNTIRDRIGIRRMAVSSPARPRWRPRG